MAIYVKKDESSWDEVSNLTPDIKVKTGLETWTDVALVQVKTGPTTWTVVWDNYAPPPVFSSSSTAADAVDTSSITLTWTQPAMFGFVKYQFTTNGGATWGDESTNANLRTKTWTGLSERTAYTVGVRVINASGRVGDLTRTITTANSVPAAPTGLTRSAPNPNQIDLSWTASTSGDRSSYDIYEGATFIKNVPTGTSTSVGSLGVNTAHTYTIYTKDTSGAASAGVSFTAITTPNVGGPGTLTATVTVNHGTINLSWDAAAHADEYYVYKFNFGSFAWDYTATVAAGTTTWSQYVGPSSPDHWYYVTSRRGGTQYGQTRVAYISTGKNAVASYTQGYDSGYFNFTTDTFVDGGEYYYNPPSSRTIGTIFLRGVTIFGDSASGMGNITSSTRQSNWMLNGTLTQWATGVGKPFTGSRGTSGSGLQGIRITGTGWFNNNRLAGEIRFTGTDTIPAQAEVGDSITYS
jgi:hypothetical protein